MFFSFFELFFRCLKQLMFGYLCSTFVLFRIVLCCFRLEPSGNPMRTTFSLFCYRAIVDVLLLLTKSLM